MNTLVFQKIKSNCFERLASLNPKLYYHNINHTIDVLEQAERIAGAEGISDPHEIFMLKVASLYHDSGFLNVYSKHEEKSCSIFLEEPACADFTTGEKEIVCNLIMATQIPQRPKNLLEKIICDADLDYLGREDFLIISDSLRREFLEFGVVKSNEEWEVFQYNFLKEHEYFTTSSRLTRGPSKKEYFQKIESKIPLFL